MSRTQEFLCSAKEGDPLDCHTEKHRTEDDSHHGFGVTLAADSADRFLLE
jgi:hypothetical protein